MLSILIESHTEDFFQRRDDIAFTLVAVSHQDSTQTHLKRERLWQLCTCQLKPSSDVEFPCHTWDLRPISSA